MGKQIFPTLTEFNEINWSNLRHKLKELSITTKFPSVEESGRFSSVMSSSPSSSMSSSSPALNPSEVYSNTLFNYLNDCNQLQYLALADFTLKFPHDSHRTAQDQETSDEAHACTSKTKKNSNVNKEPHNLCMNDLKYLYLRNIRNVKALSAYQTLTLKSFLTTQHNLHTLDLTGLYLNSSFICSILGLLNNLR